MLKKQPLDFKKYREMCRAIIYAKNLSLKEKILAWHIMDRTMGVEKYKDPMWVTVVDTGICKTSVFDGLKLLVAKNIIAKVNRDYHGTKYELNDMSEWNITEP